MSKPILVLNCGSSSIKYQMIDVETEEVLAKGMAQRIGDSSNDGEIEHEVGGESHVVTQKLPHHEATLSLVVQLFHEHGPDLDSCIAVAHRAVHGGSTFVHPTLIDDAVVATLVELSPLAPLHNPPGIAGIHAARAVLPDVPHIAVFDTAFFGDLPAEAYTYAIDATVAKQYGVRRYGFHGTSHGYVSRKVRQFLWRDDLRQIVCHLGNGASISAVDGDRAVETSMGLTPVQGLVMGTRSGDIDAGVHQYLMRQAGWTIDEMTDLLNKRSGMLGLTGLTDMRDVIAAVEAGEEPVILGWNVYLHRLVSYIGAYHVVLGGAQAITFTAGIGENLVQLRRDVCRRLACLGVTLDEDANAVRSRQPRIISRPDSAITILVVPTNEELSMAQQAAELIGA